MAKMYKPGTKLRIELKSGDIYEGQYFSGNTEIILDNVSRYSFAEKYNILCNFYKIEVASVRKIGEEKISDATESRSEVMSISLCDGEYEKLEEIAYNYIHIAAVDNDFFEAVNHINLCDTISVIGLGSNFGRRGKIHVLAVGTKSKIFVFDLKLSGESAINKGLRKILESEDITKVVHNSKIISDCLHHSYKIALRNVFDTQVVDFFLAKEEKNNSSTLRTFSDCLSSHLNLPNNILNKVEPSLKYQMQRPLNEIKKTVALEVTYLYLLKKCIEKKVLINFNTHVDGYQKSRTNIRPNDPLQHYGKVFRRACGILDNLTPENFKELSDDLLGTELNSVMSLKVVMLLIQDKALDEPCMCAQLCKRLSKEAPSFEAKAGSSTFRLLLLSKCQYEFENRSEAIDEFDDYGGMKQWRELTKHKVLGNIKFIGELAKHEMLGESILHKCIMQLLLDNNRRSCARAQRMSEDFECLCQLLRTCGRILDTTKGKKLMDQYFKRMTFLAGSQELSPRIRFMVKEVIKLRCGGWATTDDDPCGSGGVYMSRAGRRMQEHMDSEELVAGELYARRKNIRDVIEDMLADINPNGYGASDDFYQARNKQPAFEQQHPTRQRYTIFYYCVIILVPLLAFYIYMY